MRTEEDIFTDLQNLCTSPGYIHAIAFICFRENTAPIDELNNIITKDRFEQLIRNEISTLIGLMNKSEINYVLPSPDALQGYIDETEKLLAEMHRVISNPLHSSINNVASDNQNTFTVGDMLRESIFYSPESAYIFQYRDMAVARYESDNKWLKQNKSFSIQEVKRIFLAIEEFQNIKLNEILAELRDVSPDNLTILPAFTFSIDNIAKLSGISKLTIKAVLDAFTNSQDDKNEMFCSIQDFNSSNATPILETVDGKYILFQISCLAESIYESPYYWFNEDKSYRNMAAKNRGDFTEEFCRKRLELVFGKKNVFKNIKINAPNNIEYGEIDVLVVFGSRAIILQAKSKRLTIEARKGQDGYIKDDFKKSVQDAYNQGLSCAQVLCDSRYPKRSDANQNIIVPENIKEIYILCVVADHYPSLNFQARQFLKYETTVAIQPPMVLDVFAIDVITEFLQSPLYLLSYINRRVNYTNEVIASNELVILSHHLRHNLWINSGTIVGLDDTLAADLDFAMAVRRLGEIGNDTPAGILTRLKSTAIYNIINFIKSTDNAAAIELGFLLLSLSEQSILGMNTNLENIASLCRKDSKPHNFSMIFDSGVGLTVHCCRTTEDSAKDRLQSHCLVKKYFQKATKWFGMSIHPDDLSLRFCLELDFEWQQSDDMDKITSDTKNRNIANNKFKKKNHKIGRNDPCPCGSGRKYKKCCLK